MGLLNQVGRLGKKPIGKKLNSKTNVRKQYKEGKLKLEVAAALFTAVSFDCNLSPEERKKLQNKIIKSTF